jgi:hypothetical protein
MDIRIYWNSYPICRNTGIHSFYEDNLPFGKVLASLFFVRPPNLTGEKSNGVDTNYYQTQKTNTH